jgi:Xaa-Pro aminopeptidase
LRFLWNIFEKLLIDMIEIGKIRELMSSRGVDAIVVGDSDPHFSEYPADCFCLRSFLSGFDGSNGTLVVTKNDAALWTDSRYYLQAAEQLKPSGIRMVKQESECSIPEFLASVLNPENVAALNPWTTSLSEETEYKRAGVKIAYDENLYESLWFGKQPKMSDSKLFVHSEKYAGESVKSKIEKCRKFFASRNADAMLVSTLDEVAWVTNLRGADALCTPIFYSYLIIEKEKSTLFVDTDKITDEISEYMRANAINVTQYSLFAQYLHENLSESQVLLENAKCNIATSQLLNGKVASTEKFIENLKAVKNHTQLECERKIMVDDGVALVRLLMWLEKNRGNGLHETDVAEKIAELRKHSSEYICESFDTIAGFADHGAIVHYSAKKCCDYTLTPDNIILIDTGGNYLGGTTDITRTVSLTNAPSTEQKRDYTLVLKGHIAIQMQKFPAKTVGFQIDTLARQYLWQAGLNYGHGTGHGVGHFLGVHEGPQSMSKKSVDCELKEGMFITDEPGLYRAGKWGIRIENMLAVKKAENTEFGEFMQFETLTLCPYDRKLIETSLLTNEEKKWLNDYHRQVRQKLTNFLNVEENAWLEVQTKDFI